MLTIAELPEYIRIADKLLQRLNGKMSSATWLNIPKLANMMEGTGGVRKLRWGRRGGQGESGGRSHHLLLSR